MSSEQEFIEFMTRVSKSGYGYYIHVPKIMVDRGVMKLGNLYYVVIRVCKNTTNTECIDIPAGIRRLVPRWKTTGFSLPTKHNRIWSILWRKKVKVILITVGDMERIEKMIKKLFPLAI